MLASRLYSDWHEPPTELDFNLSYDEVLQQVQALLGRSLKPAPSKPPASFYHDALELYIKATSVPRLLLTYQIAMEFGLPLPPGRFLEFEHEKVDLARHTEEEKQQAHQLFLEALATVREIFALKETSLERLSLLIERIPRAARELRCIQKTDKYTWRASNPASIQKLAQRIRQSDAAPALILGAAHGSIRPGIMLSNLLDLPLYFLRFSLFKREDKEPVIGRSDRAFMARFKDKSVLLFDEDVAKGKTLGIFTEQLGRCFAQTHTAAILCHMLAAFQPDFVGEVFL